MKALITGHLGFVGRHFTRYLKDRGWDVEGMDIKDGEDCMRVLPVVAETYDLVVHLAALVGGRATIDGQPLKVANDLAIDATFFNWAVATKQPRVVYYSSSAAYPLSLQTGAPTHLLREDDINLEDPRKPDQTYGWAKLTGEMLAEHARNAGVKVYVLRPFSGYGEDQDDCYPFPAFIKRALSKPKEFDIWGAMNQVRDFIHIDDVVAATMAVVEDDCQAPVNLGWGRPTSMQNLAEMVMQAVGHSVPTKVIPGPLGVMYRCSANHRMLWHYKPKIDLEEGIALAVKAMRAT